MSTIIPILFKLLVTGLYSIFVFIPGVLAYKGIVHKLTEIPMVSSHGKFRVYRPIYLKGTSAVIAGIIFLIIALYFAYVAVPLIIETWQTEVTTNY